MSARPPPRPGDVVTRIVGGLSGAGVYRVEAAGHAYVRLATFTIPRFVRTTNQVLAETPPPRL